MSYFFARIRAYLKQQHVQASVLQSNLGSVESATTSPTTTATATATAKRCAVSAELNYAACFVAFGVAWNCFWIIFFPHVDVRMNAINLIFLMVVMMNGYFYKNLRIKCHQMHKFAFSALMTLFTLYCLFTGGTNSPFFIILISVACFYHAHSWKLQLSFFLFFLIYCSTFIVPKAFQTKLASADMDAIYRLNFFCVVVFLAVLYIFYPQVTHKRPPPKLASVTSSIRKKPEKRVMINDTPLVINRTRMLGKGSYGVVYQGQFGAYERVAVKVLPSNRCQEKHSDLLLQGRHFSYCCENIVRYHVYYTDLISKYV
jgi:hypothetical protein